MKRHALLIGYTGRESQNDSTLHGVSADLNHYKKYLQSLKGGFWLDNEITVLEDTDLPTLNSVINRIKLAKNDVVFTVFSGHGWYSDKLSRRMICISETEEVSEEHIANLAQKQILILDSCSGRIETCEKKSMALNEAILERTLTSREKRARDLYEAWCMSCPIQDLRFYAAARGTYANDDEQGGVYSTALLSVLNDVEENLNINDAHDMAAQIVMRETNQMPSKLVPRISKYLPGALDVL